MNNSRVLSWYLRIERWNGKSHIASKALVGDYPKITSWIRKFKLVIFSFTCPVCIIFVKREKLVLKILFHAKGLFTTAWDFICSNQAWMAWVAWVSWVKFSTLDFFWTTPNFMNLPHPRHPSHFFDQCQNFIDPHHPQTHVTHATHAI